MYKKVFSIVMVILIICMPLSIAPTDYAVVYDKEHAFEWLNNLNNIDNPNYEYLAVLKENIDSLGKDGIKLILNNALASQRLDVVGEIFNLESVQVNDYRQEFGNFFEQKTGIGLDIEVGDIRYSGGRISNGQGFVIIDEIQKNKGIVKIIAMADGGFSYITKDKNNIEIKDGQLIINDNLITFLDNSLLELDRSTSGVTIRYESGNLKVSGKGKGLLQLPNGQFVSFDNIEGGMEISEQRIYGTNAIIAIGESRTFNGEVFILNKYRVEGRFSIVRDGRNIRKATIEPFIDSNKQGHQSSFIDILGDTSTYTLYPNDITINTVGYNVEIFYDFKDYKDSKGNKIFIERNGDKLILNSEGKLEATVGEEGNANYFHYWSKDPNGRLEYVALGNDKRIKAENNVEFEFGEGIDFRHWEGRQAAKIELISGINEDFITITSPKENGELGILTQGIVLSNSETIFTIRNRFSKKNNEVIIETDAIDILRIASAAANLNSEVIGKNVFLRVSDKDILQLTSKEGIIYYGSDENVMQLIQQNNNNFFILSPDSNALGLQSEKAKDELEYLIIYRLAAEGNFKEAEDKLKQVILAHIEAKDGDINSQIIALQGLLQLSIQSRAELESDDALIDSFNNVRSFIEESYQDQNTRGIILTSFLIQNSGSFLHMADETRGKKLFNEQLIAIEQNLKKNQDLQEFLHNPTPTRISDIMVSIAKTDPINGKKNIELFRKELENLVQLQRLRLSSGGNPDNSGSIQALKGLLWMEEHDISQNDQWVVITTSSIIPQKVTQRRIDLAEQLALTYKTLRSNANALLTLNNLQKDIENRARYLFSLISDSDGYFLPDEDLDPIQKAAKEEYLSISESFNGLRDSKGSLISTKIEELRMGILTQEDAIKAQLDQRRGPISKIIDGDFEYRDVWTLGLGKDIMNAVGGFNDVQSLGSTLSQNNQRSLNGLYGLSIMASLGMTGNEIRDFLSGDMPKSEFAAKLLYRSSRAELTQDLEVLPNSEIDQEAHQTIVGDDGRLYKVDPQEQRNVLEFLEKLREGIDYAFYLNPDISFDIRNMFDGNFESRQEDSYVAKVKLDTDKPDYRQAMFDRIERTLGYSTAGKVMSVIDDALLNPANVALIAATLGSSTVGNALASVERSITTASTRIPVLGAVVETGMHGHFVTRLSVQLGGSFLIGSAGMFIPGKNVGAETLRELLYFLGFGELGNAQRILRRELSKAVIGELDEIAAKRLERALSSLNDNELRDLAINKRLFDRFASDNNFNGIDFKKFSAAHSDYSQQLFGSFIDNIGEQRIRSLFGESARIENGVLKYNGRAVTNLAEFDELITRLGKTSEARALYERATKVFDTELKEARRSLRHENDIDSLSPEQARALNSRLGTEIDVDIETGTVYLSTSDIRKLEEAGVIIRQRDIYGSGSVGAAMLATSPLARSSFERKATPIIVGLPKQFAPDEVRTFLSRMSIANEVLTRDLSRFPLDPNLHLHTVRGSEMSVTVAKYLGSGRADQVALASLIDDIGKLGPPGISERTSIAVQDIFSEYKLKNGKAASIREAVEEVFHESPFGHKLFASFDNPDDVIAEIKALGFDVEKRGSIGDFWQSHIEWGKARLEGKVDDDVLRDALSHHRLQGYHPFDEPSKTMESRVLQLVDIYESRTGRGGKSHEEAMEYVQEMVDRAVANGDIPASEVLEYKKVTAAIDDLFGGDGNRIAIGSEGAGISHAPVSFPTRAEYSERLRTASRYVEEGRYDDALPIYNGYLKGLRDSIKTDPSLRTNTEFLTDIEEVWRNLEHIHLETGETKKVAELYDDVIDTSLRLGNPDLALDAGVKARMIRATSDLAPDSEALATLSLLRESGDYRSAVELYRRDLHIGLSKTEIETAERIKNVLSVNDNEVEYARSILADRSSSANAVVEAEKILERNYERVKRLGELIPERESSYTFTGSASDRITSGKKTTSTLTGTIVLKSGKTTRDMFDPYAAEVLQKLKGKSSNLDISPEEAILLLPKKIQERAYSKGGITVKISFEETETSLTRNIFWIDGNGDRIASTKISLDKTNPNLIEQNFINVNDAYQIGGSGSYLYSNLLEELRLRFIEIDGAMIHGISYDQAAKAFWQKEGRHFIDEKRSFALLKESTGSEKRFRMGALSDSLGNRFVYDEKSIKRYIREWYKTQKIELSDSELQNIWETQILPNLKNS